MKLMGQVDLDPTPHHEQPADRPGIGSMVRV
jgi:hypothetical protein